MRTRDLRVVGIAFDGKEAIEVVGNKQPDVVLMNVRMPKMDGVREVPQQTGKVDHGGPAQAGGTAISSLSHRELDLLKCLLEGLSNKEIAEKLFLAEQTVKNHPSVIYLKLEVKNRSQALAMLANKQLNLSP